MVTMTAKASSNVLCEAVHGPSGVVLKTDAPKDVGGNASSFSPTDLLGLSLLTCIMTTMGLAANKMQLDLTGMQGSVEKTMTTTLPRRVQQLTVSVDLPVSPDMDARAKLEAAAHGCPVHHSLHPDIVMDIKLNWKA